MSAAHQTTPATPRRRLAVNVICMFGEDRPPVVKQSTRGSLPRSIRRMRAWCTGERLPIGSICWFNWVLVRVTGHDLCARDGFAIRIRSLSDPFEVLDEDGLAMEAWAEPGRLRRVHRAWLPAGGSV